MTHRTSQVGAVALLALSLMLFGCDSSSAVSVQTPNGVLLGKEQDGVRAFLGVPYAEPPLGDMRWQPPQPKKPWSGMLNSTVNGQWCTQFDYERRDEGDVHAGAGWTVFRDIPPNLESGEDCLNLNIWAPPDSASTKPVVVFFHGNALGNSFPLYNGESFAKAGIIYVAANYRLHSLGIFAHPALTRDAAEREPLGRYSEMDRIEVLRWVRKHIAAFGGDPDRVTVMGNSEGGAGILQLMTNLDAEGLFHQAIVQSGNGWWSPMSHQQHEQMGCILAKDAGLDGCNASSEELRALPPTAIPATGPYTIDERHWQRGATEAIERGKFIDVPLMIGWNDFDGSSLRYSSDQVIKDAPAGVLAQYDENAPSEDLAYELYTDLHSGAPARWVAHAMEDDAPVYLYLFSYVISWDRGDVRGAEHAYEIPHAFNTLDAQLNDMFPGLARVLPSSEDRQMTDIAHSCWVSFIKTGKPKCNGAPSWPAYKRSSDELMELTLNPSVLKGYRSAQLNAHEVNREKYFDRVQRSYEDLLGQN